MGCYRGVIATTKDNVEAMQGIYIVLAKGAKDMEIFASVSEAPKKSKVLGTAKC